LTDHPKLQRILSRSHISSIDCERISVSDVPLINTVPPGPNAKKVVEKDRRYLATTTKTSPVVASSAQGSIVTDVDGNRYVDFTSGIAVLNLGHRPPKVVKAVEDQLGKLWHFAGTDFYYGIQADLAEKLAGIAPGDMEKKVFFSNSGAEAVEAALKVAKWHSGRKRFIAFVGAFHGRTIGALSLTASKPVQRGRFFPLMPGVTHIPYPNCYRCPYKLEYPSCDCWCAKVLDEVYLQTMVPPEEVAAMFVEPIQGEGGYVVPPSECIRVHKRTCEKHGIIFVDDEVQAGMGRTGKMWAIEHHDVVPDVICSAKALGSGMPIGATIFDAKLDFGVQGAHSNTYGGNLIACSSALATIDAIEEEGLVHEAERKGEHLRKRLMEMMGRFEVIGDVRGLGLMQATEFVKDRETKEYAVEERDLIVELSYKKGLILLPCGRSGIRYIPPLNIEMDHLDAGLDVLEEAIGAAVR